MVLCLPNLCTIMSSKVTPSSAEKPPIFSEAGFDTVEEKDGYKKETSTFFFRDKNFHCTYWRPTSVETPKGLIFVCHGYAEYVCPSYNGVAETLAKDGFLVFGHDHTGHGRSDGQRVQVDSMDDYVLPMTEHVKKLSRDFEDKLPIFAIGHSMGGLITTYAAIAEPELFKGIVFMGPLIQMSPDIATPFKVTLAGWMKGLIPSFALGKIEAEAITRDESVVKEVKDDPLGWHGGFRAQHSYVLIKACEGLADGELLKKITVPVVIFQGEKDRLVYPPGAKHLHENVGSAKKKLLTYPDAFHNLYVELDDVKNEVIKETLDWISNNV